MCEFPQCPKMGVFYLLLQNSWRWGSDYLAEVVSSTLNSPDCFRCNSLPFLPMTLVFPCGAPQNASSIKWTLSHFSHISNSLLLTFRVLAKKAGTLELGRPGCQLSFTYWPWKVPFIILGSFSRTGVPNPRATDSYRSVAC